MKFRLSDTDRQRLGIEPEWIELDPNVGLTMLEAEGLDDAGYDPDVWGEEVQGVPVFRDGEPVMIDVLDDDDQPVVEDGQPVQVQERRVKLRAIRAAVWIAARRAGSKEPFETFDFTLSGLRRDAPEPEGKDTDETQAPPSDS